MNANFQDKLIAAVCHGPAALTEAELNGKPLVKDKKVWSSLVKHAEHNLRGPGGRVHFHHRSSKGPQSGLHMKPPVKDNRVMLIARRQRSPLGCKYQLHGIAGHILRITKSLTYVLPADEAGKESFVWQMDLLRGPAKGPLSHS